MTLKHIDNFIRRWFPLPILIPILAFMLFLVLSNSILLALFGSSITLGIAILIYVSEYNSITKYTVRIKEIGNFYYPQWKGMFFWHPFYNTSHLYLSNGGSVKKYFSKLEDAKTFLEKSKNDILLQKDKVKYHYL